MTSRQNIEPSDGNRAASFVFDYGLGGLPLLAPLILMSIVKPEYFLFASFFTYVLSTLIFTYFFPGQSIGKLLMATYVVNLNGEATTWRTACIRVLAKSLLYFSLVMSLLLADEKLEKATGFGFVCYLVVEYFCFSFLSGRRTFGDLLAKTIVVKSPPVKPHRAPAGPMYSETDAEFGNRPKRHKSD
jgi:uncharacterized RDD family membrane protein YckC